MKQRFRMFRRGRVYWCQDNQTGRQESLGTKDQNQAKRLLHARNEAHLQPTLNLQIARTYLVASDPEMAKRTWQTCFEAIIATKQGATQLRWQTANKDMAFGAIRSLALLETRGEHFLSILESGTVSTNVYLRRLHNFALDMNWLPWPVLSKKRWPTIRFKEKRAIESEEHARIIGIEWDDERKAYYELLWHFGGSQSDVALLCAEDIEWDGKVITYARKKTREIAQINISVEVEKVLRRLPQQGALFPRIAAMDEKHRASEFKRRCKRLQIEGVTLHSYRYAWAERAKKCGYPERFAQQALGHNSKAVHRAYARKAQVVVPPLEDYERAYAAQKVIPVTFQQGQSAERPERPSKSGKIPSA
jgi:integrase